MTCLAISGRLEIEIEVGANSVSKICGCAATDRRICDMLTVQCLNSYLRIRPTTRDGGMLTLTIASECVPAKNGIKLRMSLDCVRLLGFFDFEVYHTLGLQ